MGRKYVFYISGKFLLKIPPKSLKHDTGIWLVTFNVKFTFGGNIRRGYILHYIPERIIIVHLIWLAKNDSHEIKNNVWNITLFS